MSLRAALVGWTVGVATRNSLGTLGTLLSAALIGTGIWLLTRIGVVHADSASAITWLALVALAILLAIGLSWSHIWRRLSGQLEVDDNSH
jgi:ABC-type Mn2+/Zn2+ transport system permease subunit